MSVINYYEELGISETSSLDDVKKSIKSNRRRYRQLTGSPNIDQRSMAERKMEVIAQAEKVFESEETRQKYDRELENSKQSSEGVPDSTPTNHSNSSYLDSARQAFYSGKKSLAYSYIEEALKINRNDADVWYFKAMISLEDRKLSDAELAISEANRLRPKNADILSLLGDVYCEQNQQKFAIQYYQEAFELSNNSFYLLKKGRSLFLFDQYKQAVKDVRYLYDHYLEENKNNEEYIYYLLSCSYREIGDNEEAYNFARKLIDVSDSLEHKLHYAGILFLKSEDECESYLDTLNERYGNNHDFQQVYFKLLLDITIERMKKAPDTDVEAFFRKYIDRTKYENEAVLDNKARVRIAEAYLAKAQSLGIENKIRDNDFYNEFIENKNYINYATTRHSQGMGCLMFILVFAANWFLSGFFDKFVHSFWISNALSLALLSNIVLYYNYPKGWQINRRKKG